MANPYTGSSITGCNSPAVGADKDTYTGSFDAQAEAIDNHDHTSGKGKPIGTNAISALAVTAPKIGSMAVIAGKIYESATVDADRPVNTDAVRDGAITAPKLGSGSATQVKLGALNTALSSTSNFSTSGTAEEDVTNLTASITPLTTRGVSVSVQPIDTGDNGIDLFVSGGGTTDYPFYINIYRDSTKIARFWFLARTRLTVALSAIRFEDDAATIAAHTYKITAHAPQSGTFISITGAKLRVREA
jgi:hypothetical protein